MKSLSQIVESKKIAEKFLVQKQFLQLSPAISVHYEKITDILTKRVYNSTMEASKLEEIPKEELPLWASFGKTTGAMERELKCP